ncbi:hypothetical protein ACFLSV_05665 [Bacteroidota bacterium]
MSGITRQGLYRAREVETYYDSTTNVTKIKKPACLQQVDYKRA